MNDENEVTVVVEDHAAVVETHAETEVALAEIHAEKEVAVAELQAEAIVAVAEAQAEQNVAGIESVIVRLDLLAAENAALRNELSELRAILESEADDIEDRLREEIAAESEHAEATEEVVNAIESGEVPASVPEAEALEPAPAESIGEHQRKRHFVRI